MSTPLPGGSLTLPNWYRGLAIVVGLVSIILAFVVLLDPVLAVATLILLLAFALLIIGIDRLIAGVTGHPFGTFMSGAPRGLVNEALGAPPPASPGMPPSNPPKP
ncbi:MAG TPA: hypothetical protein VMC82_02055 [Thermoplasmata archaeon]|nr:hypothetical protein [Thermoplasmata archaeon]